MTELSTSAQVLPLEAPRNLQLAVAGSRSFRLVGGGGGDQWSPGATERPCRPSAVGPLAGLFSWCRRTDAHRVPFPSLTLAASARRASSTPLAPSEGQQDEHLRLRDGLAGLP